MRSDGQVGAGQDQRNLRLQMLGQIGRIVGQRVPVRPVLATQAAAAARAVQRQAAVRPGAAIGDAVLLMALGRVIQVEAPVFGGRRPGDQFVGSGGRLALGAFGCRHFAHRASVEQGFFSTSSAMNASTSRFDSVSSLIAC
ncbi:hypothetical protein GCM10020258_22150 [Sphingomonas yabuuchiae]